MKNASLFLLVLLVLGINGGARPPDTLADRIDKILAEKDLQNGFWGVYVQDLQTRQVLYRRNATTVMMPASNQKLLTTATALDALGSDYRYHTSLYFDGEVDGDVLRGDLVIEGSGDPSFGSREVKAADPLKTWAEALAAMGVRRIEGRIIGDDDAFDDDAYATGWDIQHITSEAWAPPRGGLVYRDNLVEVKLAATRPGRPLTVKDDPAGFLTIRNETTTGAKKRGPQPKVVRPPGTNSLRLVGEAPQTYAATLFLPIHDPTAFTLHTFRHALRSAGIDVAATLHDVDMLDEKPTYDGAEPLFVSISPPLTEILAIINKESNNLYAEQVFHSFGWGGTSEGGARRVLALLERLGVPTTGLSVRDGSGLSRKDLVTPETLGLLLARLAEQPEFKPFEASLAAGGEAGTTLQYRLRGIPVRAKTGSLEYVRTLSGYATATDGRRLAFVLMANHYTAPGYRITQALDSIVMMLTSTPLGLPVIKEDA